MNLLDKIVLLYYNTNTVIFDVERPIYAQIVEMVKKWVFSGRYRPGQRVPSVRELARTIRVNPNTVAKAYYELEREGFLVTRRGDGTFVTGDIKIIEKEKKKMFDEKLKRWLQDLEEMGIKKGKIEEIKKILEEIWKK